MEELPIKEIHVVIGMVHHDGKFLFQERKHKNPMWNNKWEFPGGKVEKGELYEQTLLRELKEETGIEPISVEFVGDHVHDWNLEDICLRVHLHCFRCEADHMNNIREEYSTHKQEWLTVHELLERDFLKGIDDMIYRFILGDENDANQVSTSVSFPCEF